MSRFKTLVNEMELAAPGSNTDIPEASLTVETKRSPQVYRVSGCFQNATVFKAIVTPVGGTAQTIRFRNGDTLAAGSLGTFDVPVQNGADFQLQIETDGLIRQLTIVRLLLGGDV